MILSTLKVLKHKKLSLGHDIDAVSKKEDRGVK